MERQVIFQEKKCFQSMKETKESDLVLISCLIRNLQEGIRILQYYLSKRPRKTIKTYINDFPVNYVHNHIIMDQVKVR